MIPWSPFGARYWSKPPEPGMILAIQHEVYRVMEVNPAPEDLWEEGELEMVVRGYHPPCHVVCRPIKVTKDTRDHDVHYRWGGKHCWTLHIFPDEHYPICASCGEPVPCREKWADMVVAHDEKIAESFSVPRRCPACSKPVTAKQEAVTFEENLYIPLGPPVTFHAGRMECIDSAAAYEKRWAKLDPANRPLRLSCPGVMTVHNDGTYECQRGAECPGPHAVHRGSAMCRCEECHVTDHPGCYVSFRMQLVNRATGTTESGQAPLSL